MTPPSLELRKLIDSCHPDVRQFVANLDAKNAKLHKKNIKLEVDIASLTNKNKALMDECQDLKRRASRFADVPVRERIRLMKEARTAERAKP